MAAYLSIAESQRGTKETPGPGDNPDVVKYLRTTNIGSPEQDNDETPWCSAFVNWVAEEARKRANGMSPKGTGRANARSWLDWGLAAPGPLRGAVVIFKRGTPPQGHVAFCIDRQGDRIRVIGGNQSDAVTIASYPIADVLGYRIPRTD